MIRKVLILFFLFFVQTTQAIEQDSFQAGQFLARARLLYEKENYDSLGWYYSMAFELSREQDSLMAAQCLLGLAEYYRITSEFDSVKVYLSAYEKYIEGRYFSGNGVLLDSDREPYSTFFFETGNEEEAIRKYQDALKIRKRRLGLKHPLTSRVLFIIGVLYVKENQPDSALKYLQEALVAATGDFDVSDPAYNPDPEDLNYYLEAIRALKLKAFVLSRLAGTDTINELRILHLENATECLGLAVKAIHLLRTTRLSEESRLYLSAHERTTFLLLVDNLVILYNLTGEDQYLSKAYVTVEQVKYATFLSVIENQDALKLGNIPRGLQDREQELKEQISLYNYLISNEMQNENPDSLKMDTWIARLYDYNQQRKNLVRLVQRRYPEYYSLKYDDNVLDAESVMKNIREDETVVEYLLRDTLLQVFVLNPLGFRYIETDLDKGFFSDLQLVSDYIRIGDDRNPDGPSMEFCYAANRLYQILFQDIPIEPERNLIIIPDGILAYLPFDVLLTEHIDSENYAFNELPYLLVTNPVRYAYSATLMYHSKRWVNRARKNLVLFAPSAIGNDSLFPSEKVRQIDPGRNNIVPLKYSEEEVRSIKNIIGGDLMLGQDASESAFKSIAYRYRVLHLAVHTFIDDEDPLNTMLIFTVDSLHEQDGILKLNEIYGLNLNAQMVVLSGCNSKSGLLKHGEGIMSLARAFCYSGVPNIVLTLWTVQDESGDILMTGFYRNLIKGKTKEAALRDAKLAFLKNAGPEQQHPYFWSGFVVIGDNEAVFKPRAAKFLLIGLLFVIAILGIISKNRLSKRKGMSKDSLQNF